MEVDLLYRGRVYRMISSAFMIVFLQQGPWEINGNGLQRPNQPSTQAAIEPAPKQRAPRVKSPGQEKSNVS